MLFVEEKIPAKVNLSLAVTGKRGGMHTLCMIVAECEDLFDEVYLSPEKGSDFKLRFAQGDYKELDEGRFAKFLAPKLKLVSDTLNIGGELTIRKNIPLGGGLGGSSAAIAGTLRLLDKLGYDLPFDPVRLGGDVPAMMRGGLLRVEGVGEILTPLSYPKKLEFDVQIAEGGVDSAACYALYDKMASMGEFFPSPIPMTVKEALSSLRNDLTLPATRLNPNVKTLLESMKKTNSRVIMSGSGSAVVAIRER